MPARTPSVDLAQAAVQPGPQAGIDLPPGQPRQVVGDGRQPVDARAALAGALARQIVGHPRRLHQPAGFPAEHDDDAHPGGGPDGTERERGVGRREARRLDPGTAVPADEERLGRTGRGGPIGHVDQRSPPVDLHHAGVLHGTRDRHEGRPRVFDQSVAPERPRTGAGDHGHVRQGLCVVDQRAPAPDTEGRALVRAEGRKGLAGLDPARQRRLLAGDEAIGRAHHDFGNGREGGRHALVQRPHHCRGDLVAPLGHAHDDARGRHWRRRAAVRRRARGGATS